VLSFIRGSWGNQANAVSPGNIGPVRKALANE
jgi:hypothetical protein